MNPAYTYTYEEFDIDCEAYERTSDIIMAPAMNYLLLMLWAAMLFIGFCMIFLAKFPVVGGLIIGIPTFLGMVIKPTFALSIMMLVLPTGAGIGFRQAFSLDRGIGLAMATSFMLNVIITRPKLRIGNRVLWVMMAYTLWIGLASLAAGQLSMELSRAFTQVQLLALIMIVYWILDTNREGTFRWGLRCYVIGTLSTLCLAMTTGASMRGVSQSGDGRFSATLGNAIDANMLAALISMAFLAAVYLFTRERGWFWRALALGAILFLPIMLLKIGSRGALVAMVFTVLSPLLFMRQVLRRPLLALMLILVVILASMSAGMLVKSGGLESSVARRLTDVGYARESIRIRMEPIRLALMAVFKRPIGTGFYGWFERTGAALWPHNDFFLLLGTYGIPGAILFTTFAVMLMVTIKRTPLGAEKLYARAVLTYLLVMGMNIGQVFKKFYWVFLAFVIIAEQIGWLYEQDTASAWDDTDEQQDIASLDN